MKAFETTPPDWSKGKTVFNFLQYLRENGYGESSDGRRMADPYYVPDSEWDRLYEEFLKYIEGGGRHG